MHYSLSNIALPAFDHVSEMDRLRAYGFEGLEVAPSRVWSETWHGLKPGDIDTYRHQVERSGLKVIGLHSLFYDQPDLGLFENKDIRAKALNFLVHLSGVCRDLGGRTLIYGGGRNRGTLSFDRAKSIAIDFCGEYCRRTENYGTSLCFEPLGPNDSDFINSAFEALSIVEAIDHPALRTQLDAKALVENNEVSSDLFQTAKSTLVHFHANEPGLGILGETGVVDHRILGGHLKEIGYDGFVSIEQKMLDKKNPLASIEKSAAMLMECYK